MFIALQTVGVVHAHVFHWFETEQKNYYALLYAGDVRKLYRIRIVLPLILYLIQMWAWRANIISDSAYGELLDIQTVYIRRIEWSGEYLDICNQSGSAHSIIFIINNII